MKIRAIQCAGLRGATPEGGWSNELKPEDCDAELPVSLGTFTGQYDRVFALCVLVDPALEEEDAELTWDVLPDGTLVAAIEAVPADVLVASNSHHSREEYRKEE